ncbi:MAG TPA: radical SAM protein [Burkholderiales bacterium]
MFSSLSKKTLARAALFQDAPVYVQFYVTARCNLTCQQCNIIYANSDVRECTIDEIERIAENFARMGVAIVLLTGGEPFARKDLPQIIRAFESRGVHVRMQTNGFATEAQIEAAVAAGGHDISISLDSLRPALQDHVNGDFPQSWNDAMRAIALFTRCLPRENSFASLGCVLMPDNVGDIEDVVRFGSAIRWYTSLVPVHVTGHGRPRGFRTFDQALGFLPQDCAAVDSVIERVRGMQKEGFLLYDSDQYLDDIKRFVRGEPTTWRARNAGVCDSPNLYFALLPNGDFAPCCDYRLAHAVPAYAPDFPSVYRDAAFRASVHDVVAPCEGCMYGSYPEMTISMRYLAAKLQRVRTFLTAPPAKDNWPLGYEELLGLARRIREEPRERPQLAPRPAKAIAIARA